MDLRRIGAEGRWRGHDPTVYNRSIIDSPTANKELIRRLYEQGFNAGDLDLVDQLVSPDVVTYNPIILDAPTGPDSILGGIEMLRRSFPDLHVEVLDLIAEGDRVAAFLRMSGTNMGDYRRGGATNRRGSLRAFFVWRVANGRLVESWGVADRFELLQQLGIIPSDDLAAKMPKQKDPIDALREPPRGLSVLHKDEGATPIRS